MPSNKELLVTRARLAKAQALARVLVDHGAEGPDVPLLPDRSRRAVEELAGVRESSDATWGLVADLVAARRDLSRYQPDDPFEGLS